MQGIAGFGSGPVQMMVYPLYWTIPTAAAVSVCVSVPLNLNMTLTYLKEIRWKKVLVPILPYMAVCSLAISFSLNVDQTLIKRIFGVFLIALSAYYLCFSRREKKPLGPWQTAAYILISALCDAFFGIGGPLMVIYFLNKTDSAKEYLGTAAAFFLINGVYNTVYRLLSGILASGIRTRARAQSPRDPSCRRSRSPSGTDALSAHTALGRREKCFRTRRRRKRPV